MKNKLYKYVPAGLNPEKEIRFFGLGLFFSFLFSLGCPSRYGTLRSSFFNNLENGHLISTTLSNNRTYVFEDLLFPDFIEILDNSLLGFFILALGMLLLTVYHYFYHFWGSKNIYLMRRLPQRYELLKRCLALPVTAACLSLLCAFLLLLIYYGIYMLDTPAQYLPPDQWKKIWSMIP